MSVVLLFVGGLFLLYLGGELLVRNVVIIAHKLKVSPLLISLTLIGFGTSTPELVTCIQAGLEGAPGLALGNIIGSNISNILLILPVAALIHPVFYHSTILKRDGPILVLSVVLMIGMLITEKIGYLAGSILILCLIVYIIFCFSVERSSTTDVDTNHERPAQSLFILLGLAIIGIICLLVGAKFLVSSAITLARLAGVSESIIGLTVVAIGTSLPELATVITASIRGHGDVIFGNIIGSNLYNVFGILGVTAVVTPLDVPPELMGRSILDLPPEMTGLSIWMMLAATLLMVLVAATGKRVSRLEGTILLMFYIGYVWLIFTT